jgi:uncharacterized protein YjiS (DUF1127 family)
MKRQFVRFSLAVLLWPFRVAEHRRCMAELAAMDDHTLKDIGLTRQDLRDATALPLHRDPTRQLRERANERAEASLRARRPPPGPNGGVPAAWRHAAE